MQRTFLIFLLFFIQPHLSFTQHLKFELQSNVKPIGDVLSPASIPTITHPEMSSERASFYAQLNVVRGTLLASEIAGKVERITFKPGQRVTKGQLLVSLQCTKEENELKRLHVDLKKYEKFKQQLVDMHSINTLELDIADIEYKEADAELSIAKAQMQKCHITAPFSGRVVKIFTKKSALISQGEPVLELAANNIQEVELFIPAKVFSNIKLGVPYNVNFSELNQSYRIQFTNLGGKIDPARQTVKMYGRVDNPSDQWLPIRDGKIMVSQLVAS